MRTAMNHLTHDLFLLKLQNCDVIGSRLDLRVVFRA